MEQRREIPGLFSTQKKWALIDECGEYHVFPSISSASRFLGQNDNYIIDRCAKGYTTAFASDKTKYVITFVNYYGGKKNG